MFEIHLDDELVLINVVQMCLSEAEIPKSRSFKDYRARKPVEVRLTHMFQT